MRTFGYEPTDEQVAQFVAQVKETTQQDAISKYVDPRQVTQAEVQAIADEEGLTLTEALAATYIGQSEAENFQAEQLATARAEYDPLATTLEEATSSSQIRAIRLHLKSLRNSLRLKPKKHKPVLSVLTSIHGKLLRKRHKSS